MTKFNQKIFQIIDIENSSFGLTFLQCSSCKFRKYFDLEEEDEKNLELRESKKDEKCRVCSTRLSMDYKFSLDLTLYSKEKGFLHSNICDLNLAMQNFLGISPSKIVEYNIKYLNLVFIVHQVYRSRIRFLMVKSFNF
ncbi:MAG: hypothetical protein MHMPM18_000387 [Marteilia pararefringens]